MGYNILIIRSQINHGGPGELTCAVVREMKRRNNNVIFVTGGGELVESLKDSGIYVHVLPQILTGNRTLIHNFEAVNAVKKIIRDEDIDRVCGMNSGATLVAYIAGHILRKKIAYVNELFGSGKEHLHKYMPFLHVVASDAQKEKIVREYGFSPEQLAVNYPSTLDFAFWNPANYDSESFREKLHIPKNHIVIGSAMMSDKGSVDKWRLVRCLLRKYPYVEFLFLGDSSRFSMVMNHLQDEDGVKRVHVLGVIERKLVPVAMKAMDIISHFLDPDEYETFGMAITEAMAMEAPVVASSIGGIKDMISNGANGYLVNSGEEYLEAVMRLIENAELRTQMGAEARRIAKERFSLKRHVDVLESLFMQQLVI